MSIDKVKPQSTPASSDVQNTGSGLVGPAALAGAGIGGAGGYFYLPRKMNPKEVVRKFGLNREDEFKSKNKDYLPHENDALESIENLEQYSLETSESIKRGGRMPHSFVDRVKDFEHLKPEEKEAAGYIQYLLRYKNKEIDKSLKRAGKIFTGKDSVSINKFYRGMLKWDLFKQTTKKIWPMMISYALSFAYLITHPVQGFLSGAWRIAMMVGSASAFVGQPIFTAVHDNNVREVITKLRNSADDAEKVAKAALDKELKTPNNESKIYEAKRQYLHAKADRLFYEIVDNKLREAIRKGGKISNNQIMVILSTAQMEINKMINQEVQDSMKELGKHVPKTASMRNAALLAGAGAILFGAAALLFHPKKTKNKDGEEQASASTKAMQALLNAVGAAGIGAVAYAAMKKSRPPKIDKALENTFDEFMKSLKGTDYNIDEKTKPGRKIIVCKKSDGKVVHEFDEKGRRVQFTQYDTQGNKIAQYDIDPQTGEQTQGTIWLQGRSNWVQRNLKFWDKHFFECNQIIDKIDRKAKTRTLTYLKNTDGDIHFKEVYNMETGAKNVITYHDSKGELPKRIEEYDENNALIRARNLDKDGNTVSSEEVNARGHRSSKKKGEKTVEYDADSEISLFWGKVKIRHKTKVTGAPQADGTREEITYSEHSLIPGLCKKRQKRIVDSKGKVISESKPEETRYAKYVLNSWKTIKKYAGKLNPFNWFEGKDVDRNQVT